ncbi:MAG: dihydrodipicolinate reductase C-terminal domain-containing protein [Vicinamibacterales bacterium]
MKLLIVGYGRMGRLVEELAVAQGHQVTGRIDVDAGDWSVPADVAIDFSTAEALARNFPRYLERALPVVIGTTGWAERAADYQATAGRAGIGVVASANFSVGVNLFQMIVAEAARLMEAHPQFGSWIHEAHHAAKRDAPSGTALLLRDAMTAAGFTRPIDVSSTRAGAIPGIHTIGFDAASDTIELTHTARDRRGFAGGALLAADWVRGRRGWFTMADVLRTS